MAVLGTVNERVLLEAREWIGTPYRHQASLKGVGCDCIGLIVGIWSIIYGSMPAGFKMPAYTAAWAEETGRSAMVELAQKYMAEISFEQLIPGDVIMFRMIRNGPTKHCGIYTDTNQLIHAYANHDVMESVFPNNKGAEFTHAFRFPTIGGV